MPLHKKQLEDLTKEDRMSSEFSISLVTYPFRRVNNYVWSDTLIFLPNPDWQWAI